MKLRWSKAKVFAIAVISMVALPIGGIAAEDFSPEARIAYFVGITIGTLIGGLLTLIMTETERE